jgi:aldehyde dehydrogenase (NAD+)
LTVQIHNVRLFIDGEYRESSDGSTVASVNPATREKMAEVAKGTVQDAKAAIDAAEVAFEKWSEVPPPHRAEILYKVGEMIRERREELARMLTMEEGKALPESLGEIDEGYDMTMFIAAEGRRSWTNVTTSEQANKVAMVVRRPVGIVGAITPWNFPFAIPLWKLAPALVGGNTVVFKPSSNTPIMGSKIVEMFEKAGLPKGVLNLLIGPGATVGEAVINDTRIKMTAFTGESATGKRIAEVNARLLRKQVLELGGKNPIVIAKDAVLDVAVRASLFAAFSNAGQKCTAASRIIIEQEVYEKFAQKFTDWASKLEVGNGLKPGVEIGPLVSDNAREKVRKYVQIGKDEGAKVATGGMDYADQERTKGFFYPPTVFTEASNDMKICQDEIFGPVTALILAKNFDDGIEIANDTRYGLSSAVYTTDLQKAFVSIKKLQTGIGYVNQGPPGAEVHLPFGGIKDSGFGREAGEAAIENYTEKKTIFIDYSYAKRPWFYPWKEY